MKVNEIQIGDWMKSNDGDVFRVTAIFENRGIDAKLSGVGRTKNGESIIIEMDECYPIQLTTEILKKNFPTAGELAWWPVEDGLHCESRNTEDIMVSGVFRFVHQLQNALRLVGIEKEIKI